MGEYSLNNTIIKSMLLNKHKSLFYQFKTLSYLYNFTVRPSQKTLPLLRLDSN